MILIVIGVAGSGKTTVGRILAARLGYEFHDADDLHPARNREKMQRGTPLSDADRWPWLHAVRALIQQCLAEGRSAIVACSALKQAYRDLLNIDSVRIRFVYLKGPRELLARRLARRAGHFFDPNLLQSQLDTLEEPAHAIVADINATPAAIANAVIEQLGSGA